MKKELNAKPIFARKIYVSHKFNGDQENIKIVENKIKTLRKEYPAYLFISPIHTFSYLYNETSYEEGLRMCLELMKCCDEVFVIDDNYLDSKGVVCELMFAHEYNIPVYHISI